MHLNHGSVSEDPDSMPFLGPLASKWHHAKNQSRKADNYSFFGGGGGKQSEMTLARVFECACVSVCLCKMASLVRIAPPGALWFLRPSRCPYAELELSHTPTCTALLRLTHTQYSWHQSPTAADCMNAVLYRVSVLLKWRETSEGVGEGFWL